MEIEGEKEERDKTGKRRKMVKKEEKETTKNSNFLFSLSLEAVPFG